MYRPIRWPPQMAVSNVGWGGVGGGVGTIHARIPTPFNDTYRLGYLPQDTYPPGVPAPWMPIPSEGTWHQGYLTSPGRDLGPEIPTPLWTEWLTDACENIIYITFLQLLFWVVIMRLLAHEGKYNRNQYHHVWNAVTPKGKIANLGERLKPSVKYN